MFFSPPPNMLKNETRTMHVSRLHVGHLKEWSKVRLVQRRVFNKLANLPAWGRRLHRLPWNPAMLGLKWAAAAGECAAHTWTVGGWWCSAQTLWPSPDRIGWPLPAGWPVEQRWSRSSWDRHRRWTCRGMLSSPDWDPHIRSPPYKPEGDTTVCTHALPECSALRCSTHHVAQPHGVVFGVVLHQRVVVRWEECATADPLSELLYHSAGDCCAVICSCAPSCEARSRWEATRTKTRLRLLFAFDVNTNKFTQFVQEHEGVLSGVAQDACCLAELHKESTLS